MITDKQIPLVASVLSFIAAGLFFIVHSNHRDGGANPADDLHIVSHAPIPPAIQRQPAQQGSGEQFQYSGVNLNPGASRVVNGADKYNLYQANVGVPDAYGNVVLLPSTDPRAVSYLKKVLSEQANTISDPGPDLKQGSGIPQKDPLVSWGKRSIQYKY